MRTQSRRYAATLGLGLGLASLLAACGNDGGPVASVTPTPAAALQLEVLSSKPELVTGGNVLVRTTLASAAAVTATLNGAAVAATFTPEAGSTTSASAPS